MINVSLSEILYKIISYLFSARGAIHVERPLEFDFFWEEAKSDLCNF